jgi:hypothetical protein
MALTQELNRGALDPMQSAPCASCARPSDRSLNALGLIVCSRITEQHPTNVVIAANQATFVLSCVLEPDATPWTLRGRGNNHRRHHVTSDIVSLGSAVVDAVCALRLPGERGWPPCSIQPEQQFSPRGSPPPRIASWLGVFARPPLCCSALLLTTNH